MSIRPLVKSKKELLYPSGDGKPRFDNTRQCRWIVTIFSNLRGTYRRQKLVFIAADLFWYAVEGDPKAVTAPDVFVVFGRPKGDRMSYMQWREGGMAPHVVFEILSPNNTAAEMEEKFQFYDRHAVEEYYLYDPDDNVLRGWVRGKRKLRRIPEMHDWKSPRLGIRFDMSGRELVIYHRDGSMFLTDEEQVERYEQEKRKRASLERQLQQARAKLRELGVELPEAADE
jgi:Uma2 family endonuclease